MAINKKGIKNLQPHKIWEYFNRICSIPHISKHEELLSEYIAEFANNLNLPIIIDNTGNIIIRKKGTVGYENHDSIILQAHIDMVPQSNIDYDFLNKPIIPLVENEWVTAKNTTLGADNGIGVATILAILESKSIQHPPIEALLTIDEETGMTGAFGLEKNLLKGKRLINLDSEDENEIIIGCVGGKENTIALSYTEENIAKNKIAFKVVLNGLLGGHSGVDIHLGRANANVILNSFIYDADKQFNISIVSFQGGGLRNAIPRKASSVIVIDKSNAQDILDFTNNFKYKIESQFEGVEKSINFSIKQVITPKKIMNSTQQNKIINAIKKLPNGPIQMNKTLKDVVDISNNIAYINIQKGKMAVKMLQRSTNPKTTSLIDNLIDKAFSVIDNVNMSSSGTYSGWQPNLDSKLLEQLKSIYKTLFEKDSKVLVIHAGLECGIILEKYPDIDMISIGPTIKFPHSPDEKVLISSVQKFWKFLIEILRVSASTT